MKRLLLAFTMLCLAHSSAHAADSPCSFQDPEDIFSIADTTDDLSIFRNPDCIFSITDNQVNDENQEPTQPTPTEDKKIQKKMRQKIRKKIKTVQKKVEQEQKVTDTIKRSFSRTIKGTDTMLEQDLFYKPDLAKNLKEICQQGLEYSTKLESLEEELRTSCATTEDLVDACSNGQDASAKHYEKLKNSYSTLCDTAVRYSNTLSRLKQLDQNSLGCVASQAQEEPVLRALTCPGLLKKFELKMNTFINNNPAVIDSSDWKTLETHLAKVTTQATTLAVGIQANALNRDEVSNENRLVLKNFTDMLKAFKEIEQKESGQA